MDYRVVVQMWEEWEESELGWGVRPDGYSLHLSEGCRNLFVRGYWDWISRPCGNPYIAEVSDDVYQKVSHSKRGIRYPGKPPEPYHLGGRSSS